jgi:hypothetical protein
MPVVMPPCSGGQTGGWTGGKLGAGKLTDGDHQRLRATAAMAELTGRSVELLGQGDARQHKPHPPAFAEHDSQVFEEMLDKESRGEVTPEQPWGEVFQ